MGPTSCCIPQTIGRQNLKEDKTRVCFCDETHAHMRTRIRFSIMSSVLVALRGQRGKPTTSAKPLAVTSFDLIPQSMAYECYSEE